MTAFDLASFTIALSWGCWISGSAKNFSVNAGLNSKRSLNALNKFQTTDPAERDITKLWG